MFTFRVLVVVLACWSLLACTGPVRYRSDDAQSRLQPGDEVVISLKSGKKYRAEVVQVTDAMLVTKRASYAWSDIRSVTREEVDAGKTAGRAVGVTLLLLAAAVWFMTEVLLGGLEGG